MSIADRLGPQLPGEAGVAKRLRFHQSWYRSEVLGIPEFGATPRPTSRPLGSILPSAAAADGRNFTSSFAEQLYVERRVKGWGVDPVRCTQYLTSSQAMTLNFLGPLYASKDWLLKTLGSVLRRADLVEVEFAAVEHAPARRSEFLGDMTRLDGFIAVRTDSGRDAIVLEFKYADRFNSRNVRIAGRPEYIRLAGEVELWKDFDAVSSDRQLNQLLRCHSLGAALLYRETSARRPTMLTIFHEDDTRAAKLTATYKEHLNDPSTAVGVSLSELCDHMAQTGNPGQRALVDELRSRYANESMSESWWNELIEPNDRTS